MDKLQHFPIGSNDFISHPSHARPGIHPYPDKLWVICCLEDPLRFRSRYANYWEFEKGVACAGGILITVESAFGGRKFEVTDPENPYHVQVRSVDELFRKENLQNIGAARLPLNTQYVAFIDADVSFVRPDWCQEALHQLQHYDVIQMFSAFSDVGPNHEIIRSMPAFMWNQFHAPEAGTNQHSGYGAWKYGARWAGAPGLAWAYRMAALNDLGGLLDRCILGGGDSHMAYGLMQRLDLAQLHIEMGGRKNPYTRYIASWQANAARLKKNIGVMDGDLLHKWHGSKSKRGYADRYKILERNHYDPYSDVMLDHNGVLRLTGNKPQLRDDLRAYFRSRDEDDVHVT